MLLPLIFAVVIGYLLGAIPFGYLMARRFGINIFEHGSKNPGATNVKRVLGEKFGAKGKRAGTVVFLLDAWKGGLATGWPLALLPKLHHTLVSAGNVAVTQANYDIGTINAAAIAGLVAALIGHSFSCFTRFRGGKGVATSAGGLLVLLPIPSAIALVVWLIVFQTSRYVSLASILAAIALPAVAWLMPCPLPFRVIATLIGLFVILRHRANITRLLNGTENKFVKK